ncbi:biotin/lipoyl-binding protein [Escherichia coli]|nr:biotin/lipoyl-binding protein [Escherichia coli]
MIKLGKSSPVNGIFFPYIMLLLCLIFLSVIIILSFGTYHKTESVTGVINIRGFTRVESPVDGIVSDVYIDTKDQITRNTPLISLDTDRSSIMIDNNQKNEDVKNKYQELLSAIDLTKKNEEDVMLNKINLLNERLEIIASEKKEIKEILKNKKYNSKIVQSRLKRTELLLKNNYATKEEISKIKEQNNDILVSIKEYKLKYLSLDKENNSILSEIEQITSNILQGRTAYYQQRQNILDKIWDIGAEGNVKVISSKSGVVDSIFVKKGDVVKKGNIIAIIDSAQDKNNKIEFLLKVDSNAIGFIANGNIINVEVDAFPYEHYGVLRAKVTGLSNSSLNALNVDSSLDKQFFLVTAQIVDNNKIPNKYLRNGMTVRAHIKTNSTPLYQWFFLPIKKALKREPEII